MITLLSGCSGSSCKDACTPGTKACEGASLMTCGDFDGNGCAEWGDPFTCPDQCQVDQCVTTCDDECVAGSRRCAGVGFQVCADNDGDGCTEWGTTQSCGPGQSCSGDGQCVDECVDQCADGQRQCVTGQDQYQECTCPPNGCCDWGTAIDCGAGESCSNGQCAACSDDCTPAGARRCSGAAAYEVCGDVDDDPCNEWSAVTDCPQGQECVNGSCTDPCDEECPGTGARACTQDNRGFMTCGNYDTDPCLEYGDVKECAPSEQCADGVCQFLCSDECAGGEKRCLGNGYQTCGQHDEDPCTEWSGVTECKRNETCSNGVCSEICQDECNAGAVECSGFQSYRECGEFDHDPCRDWGEPVGCALWERCLDVAGPAECVLICFNDCEVPGEQLCAGDGFVTCEDNDWDACLEWSDVVACDPGELCSENPQTGQGECTSMPCSDDCDTEGTRECYLDVGFRACGFFDADDCLDWSQVTECGAGKRCEGGYCVDLCQNACQADTVGCLDSTTRWVCSDADGDGCLDQVPVDCEGQETCDAGVCAVACNDDNFEPNDSWEDSVDINEGDLQGQICGGNDDWYAVFVLASEGLAVNLAFTHADGDLDLELYDLDDPDTPVAVSAGVGDSESVVMPAGADAYYLIRVYGYAGAANSYDLSVDLVSAGECLDDYLEDNDSQAAAMFVLDGAYEDLAICPDDDDWYENYMFAGEDLTVEILFSHAVGDLDLEIQDAQGNQLDLSDSTTDDESLTVPIQADGLYYVWVYGYQIQAQVPYDMNITYGSPCSDDGYEPNDTLATAAAVAAGTYDTLAICPNDADWFAVTVPADSDLLASISFTHADGDLDMYLYAANGTQLDYSTSTTDDEIVGAMYLEAGTYYVRVEGFEGAENLYDLEILY